MLKKCNNCKSDFNCNANNINKCWCIKIEVSKEFLEKVNRDYSGCLCKKCFQKIAKYCPIL